MQHFVYGPLLNTFGQAQHADPLSHLCLRDGALFLSSKNEPAEVLILEQFLEALADIPAVDRDPSACFIGRVERDVLEYALHDGVEPAGADVLSLAVDDRGGPCQLVDPV